jgi:hypothetical protein
VVRSIQFGCGRRPRYDVPITNDHLGRRWVELVETSSVTTDANGSRELIEANLHDEEKHFNWAGGSTRPDQPNGIAKPPCSKKRQSLLR